MSDQEDEVFAGKTRVPVKPMSAGQSQLGRHQPTPGHASQGQFQSGQCQQFELGQIRLGAQLGSNPPSQQARPETKSGESMLEATRSCSLAGLCFCLLAISAASACHSYIFYNFLLYLFATLTTWMFVICSLLISFTNQASRRETI
jgi:hypothetical protein